jgi:hypothetical protein
MMTKIWMHLKSWPEAYVMFPLVLLAIPGSALFVYWLTGRAPQDSAAWVIDLTSRVLVASLVVLFTSFMRQATGVWLTKEEQLANPYFSTVQAVVKMFSIVVLVWLFTH